MDKSGLLGELEAIVWENLKKGDTEALGELYDLYIDILVSYGLQQSQDKGHVMDCIHDVFLDLYKYRANLAKTDNIKYYLFKSLRRKINRKYYRKIIPDQRDTSLSEDSIHESINSAEDDIILSEHSNELSLRLREALKTLTEKQKKGIFLRFDQEKSYEDIAEMMDISIQTARTTIYRALKTLRQYPFLFPILLKLFFLK